MDLHNKLQYGGGAKSMTNKEFTISIILINQRPASVQIGHFWIMPEQKNRDETEMISLQFP